MKKAGGLGSALSGLSGLSGIAGAIVPFVGFLDAVSNVEHVYLLLRGLSSYTGNLVRLRRNSDNLEADFTWDAATQEFLDIAAVTIWLGGATGYVVTIYDQAAAGDDITQATALNQPELTLSDATVNNKPVLTLDGTDYLRGAFTTGGQITQPLTIYAGNVLGAGLANDNNSYFVCDSDDATNRMALNKGGTATPDKWSLYFGVTLFGSAADTNWNIWTALANGGSSVLWINGVSNASGNAGAHNPDGITLGAAAALASYWVGRCFGIVIVDGNSSNADKNIIGNKFETVYSISYTDIV